MKRSDLVKLLSMVDEDLEVMLECESPNGHVYVNEIIEVFYDSDKNCIVIR